jgi:hypothetical protein
MVIQINAGDLQAIPTGDPLPSKFSPQTLLQDKAIYQVKGNSEIYLVSNNTLRLIPDPETLQYLGYNSTQVITVSAQDFKSLSKGTAMPSRKDSAFIQVSGTLNIYVMENGIKRLIPNLQTFKAMNPNGNIVQKLNQQDFDAIITGPDVIAY